MKLLLFSDVHCSMEHCRELVQKSSTVDVVIGAGDLGLVRKGLQETIDALKAIEKPTVLVPGNSESREELEDACRGWDRAVVLHGTGIEISGMQFWGVGGGIPVTPFGDWSYDFTEQEGQKMLSGCPPGGILVTHSPPHGVLDISSAGQHFGSRAVREAVLAKQPRLCVCGHIHESAGRHDQLEGTAIVNAGPRGMLWEV